MYDDSRSLSTAKERKELAEIIAKAAHEIAALSIMVALKKGKSEEEVISLAAGFIDVITNGLNDGIKGELNIMVKAVLAEHDLEEFKR